MRTAQGVRYTRNGQFTVSPQGLLVTAARRPGAGSRRAHRCASARTAASTRARSRSCGSTNPRKEGDNLVTGTPAGAAGTGQVRAGALEASGSDAARSMVDMIASLRAFEAGQRVIHTIDETLGKAATQVGSVTAASRAQLARRRTPSSAHASRPTTPRRMLEGLNSAAAGMAAQQQRIDAVANDLANANTTGYKRVRVGFRDLVYTQTGRSSAEGPRTGAGAAAVDAGRAFAQGALQRTDQPFDVAIQGEGFLKVRLADGRQALTRDGSLRVDGSGKLVTSSRRARAAADHRPRRHRREPRSRSARRHRARRRPPARPHRARHRALAAGPAARRRQRLPRHAAVRRAARRARPRRRSTQGALEASNVDMADAMVAMIESQRAFQLTSKAIQTQDQMWEIANGVKR